MWDKSKNINLITDEKKYEIHKNFFEVKIFEKEKKNTYRKIIYYKYI